MARVFQPTISWIQRRNQADFAGFGGREGSAATSSGAGRSAARMKSTPRPARNERFTGRKKCGELDTWLLTGTAGAPSAGGSRRSGASRGRRRRAGLRLREGRRSGAAREDRRRRRGRGARGSGRRGE